MNGDLLGDFSRIFHDNLYKRSRTAKGVSDTSSSKAKKKLLKSGDELKVQVEQNTKSLIESVWNARGVIPRSPEVIRTLMECWYDCINRELQHPNAYKEKNEELEKIAADRRRETGRNWRVNRRYRTWTVSYTNLEPLDLEFAMDDFYRNLFDKILQSQTAKTDSAELLAYADYMIDGEIHPWVDGCGRNATAAVMWLALLVPGQRRLPEFGSRDNHYRSIHSHSLKDHTEYFRQCLSST